MNFNRTRLAAVASSMTVLLGLAACGDPQSQLSEARQDVQQAEQQAGQNVQEAQREAREEVQEARADAQQNVAEARRDAQGNIAEATQDLQAERKDLAQTQQNARQNVQEAQRDVQQEVTEARKDAREEVADTRQEAREHTQDARQQLAEAREDVRQRREDTAEVREPATIAGAGTGLTGSSGTSGTSGMGEARTGVAGEINDGQITVKINAALAKDERLSAMGIDVDTEEGVVTLKGNAPTATAKARASDIARGVEGVREVQNRLEVSAQSADPARSQATAPDTSAMGAGAAPHSTR